MGCPTIVNRTSLQYGHQGPRPFGFGCPIIDHTLKRRIAFGIRREAHLQGYRPLAPKSRCWKPRFQVVLQS